MQGLCWVEEAAKTDYIRYSGLRTAYRVSPGHASRPQAIGARWFSLRPKIASIHPNQPTDSAEGVGAHSVCSPVEEARYLQPGDLTSVLTCMEFLS